MRPKRDLVRIVRTPDGDVVFDETGRVAGRGAYICRDEACWRQAALRGTISRALNTQLPAALRERLERGSAHEVTNEGGARGQE